MTRRIAVLRPEPGNADTTAQIARMGLQPLSQPLFAISSIAWPPPNPADHDALMLTSANAVRHAGPALARFAALPVLAVGARTADAAIGAGFEVVLTGTADATKLIEQATAAGYRSILHLGGRDSATAAGGVIARSIAVYASDKLPIGGREIEALQGSVALLHSARAGRRLAELVGFDLRAGIRLAALSANILAAAGQGWDRVEPAARPDEAALLDLARALAD